MWGPLFSPLAVVPQVSRARKRVYNCRPRELMRAFTRIAIVRSGCARARDAHLSYRWKLDDARRLGRRPSHSRQVPGQKALCVWEFLPPPPPLLSSPHVDASSLTSDGFRAFGLPGKMKVHRARVHAPSSRDYASSANYRRVLRFRCTTFVPGRIVNECQQQRSCKLHRVVGEVGRREEDVKFDLCRRELEDLTESFFKFPVGC